MLELLTVLVILLKTFSASTQKEELQYYDDPDDENQELKQRDRNISYHNWMRQIEKDVLSKVNYKVPPQSSDEQIDVQFIFHSVDHVTVNEKEQVMSMSGRYCMIWRDPHITWDPSKYNNLDTLHVGSYDVWTPRIVVLNGLSGVYGHLDAPVSRVKLFIPRFRANDPAYVITCPRYTGRVGCFLDMTNYPHDKHVCSFIMAAKGQTNVEFYGGRRALTNKELSVNLRHVLTRNDTRPRISGWHITNVTSRISYYDYSNITDRKTTKYSFTVAVQAVHFYRHDPSYIYTQNVPALVFVAFNIAGALVTDSAQSMGFFLMGLFLQGLFLRDFISRIPLYYDSMPKILQFFVVHLFLSAFGFLFITFKEVWRRYVRKPPLLSKYPTSIDGWTPGFVLSRILSITGAYIFISLMTIVMFLM
ncbi:hypothetical protein GCK32_004306 [Trichostrongylus colubriformis]|uniref:Neurotransmitter-gated ion-channel ligand-binding domain-containing protein n=1 Tax=Trichostrongylus colubriformis TaxID=6319 RepID=A0AAN8IRD6_TRICO